MPEYDPLVYGSLFSSVSSRKNGPQGQQLEYMPERIERDRQAPYRRLRANKNSARLTNVQLGEAAPQRSITRPKSALSRKHAVMGERCSRCCAVHILSLRAEIRTYPAAHKFLNE